MSRDASDAARPGGRVDDKGALTAQGVASLLEECVQARPGHVQAGTLLEGLAGWDSMAMVAFVGLVEQRTGLRLRVRDLRSCATPASLAQLIHDRLPG
jgi:acyl carrier protein